ncbi:hypothetical protein ACFY2Z_24530 [Streptomyces sp. NPDC001222]|uniref:hypothetical protein n=1 Tax=Streptomyces sp. NPDC001222 TaxID=3364548 RepID=UPI0036B6E320
MAFNWTNLRGGATTLIAVPLTSWMTKRTIAQTEEREAFGALLMNAYELVRAANTYRAKAESVYELYSGRFASWMDWVSTAAAWLQAKEKYRDYPGWRR